MNKQEIFDTVITHLVRQGGRSYKEGVGCAYRGNEGMRCAVGCLIPDEMYNPVMEGKIVSTLLQRQEELGYELPDYFNKNNYLLEELQFLHDIIMVSGMDEMLRKARDLSDIYKLEFKNHE